MESEDWTKDDHVPSSSDAERFFRQIHKKDRPGVSSSGLEGLLSHLYDDPGDVNMPVDLLDNILRGVRRGRMQRVLGLSRVAFVVRVGALGAILLGGVMMASFARLHVAKATLSYAQTASSSTLQPTTTTTSEPPSTTTSTTVKAVVAPVVTAPSVVPKVSAVVQAPVKKVVNSPVTLPIYQHPTTTTTTPPLVPMPQAPSTGGNGVYSTGSDCNGSNPTNGVYSSPSTCTTDGPIIVSPTFSSSSPLGSSTSSPVPTTASSTSPPPEGTNTGSPTPAIPATHTSDQNVAPNSPSGESRN